MEHLRWMMRANTGSNGKKNRHLGRCRAAGLVERAGRACPVQGKDAWSRESTRDGICWLGQVAKSRGEGSCHAKEWF